MAWLIAEALKLAGHFRVSLEHFSKIQWGKNGCGMGTGCPSSEVTDGKEHWVRMPYDIFRSFDEPPSPPPAGAP